MCEEGKKKRMENKNESVKNKFVSVSGEKYFGNMERNN